MKYEYQAKTIADATADGLRDLGVSEDEVIIEVVQKGGLFKKAIVTLELKSPKKESGIEITDLASEPTPPITEPIAREESRQRAQRSDSPRVHTKAVDFDGAKSKAVEFLEKVMPHLSLTATFISRVEDDEILIDIETVEDPAPLIGRRGDTLHALSEICRAVVNDNESDYIRITVDTADYRRRRAEKIADIARREARRSAKERRVIELEPMNAYERRIVHSALQGDKFVKTESAGEGRFRHICIIPVERKPYNTDRSNGGYNGGNRKPYDNKPREPQEKTIYDTVSPNAQQQKYDAPAEPSSPEYGTNADFRKKGTGKMRSFGGKK